MKPNWTGTVEAVMLLTIACGYLTNCHRSPLTNLKDGKLPMNQQSPLHQYPNVMARLRLSKMGPALPARENYMEIWMKGTRFRTRDESGRDAGAILADLPASRGLGVAPHSMEEIMDIWAQSLDKDTTFLGATELYGDLATGEGWVRRGRQAAWPIAAEQLTPVVEQVFANELDKHLELRGQVTRLDRLCTEYYGVLEGEDQGIPYKSVITRVVSPPYLLLSDVRDAQNPGYYYVREIVSLEEGVVDDTDLTPP